MDAQADLGLGCLHMPEDTFLPGTAHLSSLDICFIEHIILRKIKLECVNLNKYGMRCVIAIDFGTMFYTGFTLNIGIP